MQKKLFIPAAGIGSRLEGYTSNINKSLISVGHVPVISRIINGYKNIKSIVVALGYKGEYLKEYLQLAHPDKLFEFVNINPYEGLGSGLGYTMLCCKDKLQAPFIFHACDALVKEYGDEVNFDWMGYSEQSDLEAQYRTINFDTESNVVSINEKNEKKSESKIYIGVAGVNRYEEFWGALEKNPNFISLGEVAGFSLERGVRARKFEWFDIGTINKLKMTRDHFEENADCTILDKSDESIWFLDSKVYKFSVDKGFIADRIERSIELRGYVPELIDRGKHIYSYSFVEGRVLSRVIDRDILKNLLIFMESFWQRKELAPNDYSNFKNICLTFYKDKTYQRIKKYTESIDADEKYYCINNNDVGSIYDLLNKVNWEQLSNGLPSRFHGDLHFENIIYESNKKKFTLLDWRQDFSGLKEYGDIYYDLAKLYHGILVSHKIIEQDRYKVEVDNGNILIDIDNAVWYEGVSKFFIQYVNEHYDLVKVETLTALIFLNIAPLHHYPYNKFLYSKGKLMLYQTIQAQSK